MPLFWQRLDIVRLTRAREIELDIILDKESYEMQDIS